MEAVACAVTFGTVTAQLGVVTIKFKNLWDEIAGVPEKVANILEDMDFFRMLFAQMETSIKDPDFPNLPLSFWTGHLMQLSLNRAKRALTALECVTRDLDDRLKMQRKGLKRTIVAIRGLMSKEKLQSLEKRLKKAMKLLQMSYDLSSKHLQEERLRRHVTHTIRAEMAITVTALHPRCFQPRFVADTDEPTDDGQQQVAPRSLAKQSASFRWRLPSWWSTRSTTVWGVCSSPQPGWKYVLRVYNIVPEDSCIIQCVRRCDTAAVVSLFRSGRASPFDRDQDNNSLLVRAVGNRLGSSVEMCTQLIKGGLSDAINESHQLTISPLKFVLLMAMSSPEPIPTFSEKLQLLWSHYPEADDTFLQIDPSGLVLEGNCPIFYNQSLNYRLKLIRQGALGAASHPVINTLWLSSDGKVQSTHITQSKAQRLSLLHSAAVNVGKIAIYDNYYCDDKCAQDDFMQEIVLVSALKDLHYVETVRFPFPRSSYKDGAPLWTATPLISLIGGTVYHFVVVEECYQRILWKPSPPNRRSTLNALQRVLLKALHVWAHNLRCSGIDLVIYGKRERASLHDDGGCLRAVFDDDSELMNEWRRNLRIGYGIGRLPMWLFDLAYGAEPEDWDLIWVIEFEAMAREFWDMVERA